MPSSIVQWIFVLITIIGSMNAQVFPEYMDMKIKFDVANLKVNDLKGLENFVHEISKTIPISTSVYDEKAKVCVEFKDSNKNWMVAATVTQEMSLQAAGEILEKIEHYRHNKVSERCQQMKRPDAHHVLVIVKRDKHDQTSPGRWVDALSSTYLDQGVTAAVVVNTFTENPKFKGELKFVCIIEMIDRPSYKDRRTARSMQAVSAGLVDQLWAKIEEGFSNCDYNVEQNLPCHYAKGGECVVQKTVKLTKDWKMACGGNSKRLSKCQDHAECDDTCERGFQNQPCSWVSGNCVKTLPIGDQLLENCKTKTQECNPIECPEEPTQASTSAGDVSTSSGQVSTSASDAPTTTGNVSTAASTSTVESELSSTDVSPAKEDTVYKIIGQNLMIVGFLIGFVTGIAWGIMSCMQWRQEKMEAESPAAKLTNENIDDRESNSAKGVKLKFPAKTKAKTSVTKGKKKPLSKKR